MFGYYLKLALRSFRRNKALTALMVLAIALGIGASMTTLTVFHVLSGDPIPQKSDKLFYPRIDPRGKDSYQPGEDPEWQMTRFDAEALLREAKGERQALMTGGSVALEPQKPGMDPFYADARYTTADFFPMFEVPMLEGRAWTAEEDKARARVVVIAKKLKEQLFGDTSAIGKTVRLERHDFRVIGVIDEWEMTPKFYDVTGDSHGSPELLFVPFWTSRDTRMNPNGNMNCWGNSDADDEEGNTGVNAPCSWLQYWVELSTPEKAAAYRRYLAQYSAQQRAAGRFERPDNVSLDNVMAWLDINGAVPPDVRLQSWLAFGFLAVCLLNTIGLLLAKFLRRSSEIGVRRALGATRRDIFAQYLVEAGMIGVAGGALGLGLAMVGLWAVRQQPTTYAEYVHFDGSMLLITIVLTVVASLLAGLLPAWRACQITPAIQLKSQ
ncbi:MAG: ABC transporter permease [Xanthomonadaceae bacterium]|nr:ABC transporter permease [Xanthomonadaceae bacterium]